MRDIRISIEGRKLRSREVGYTSRIRIAVDHHDQGPRAIQTITIGIHAHDMAEPVACRTQCTQHTARRCFKLPPPLASDIFGIQLGELVAQSSERYQYTYVRRQAMRRGKMVLALANLQLGASSVRKGPQAPESRRCRSAQSRTTSRAPLFLRGACVSFSKGTGRAS